VKPAAFEYVVPTSLEEALEALAHSAGEAKILAGGQSLMPILNFRLARPALLIDINRLAALDYVREDGDVVRVGPLTRHYTLETSPIIARHLPVVRDAMTHVAHLAIRNRGTIGGSLAHADPAAELPMLALLLDAEIRTRSADADRSMRAAEFFVGALTTCLVPDEIIVEIVLPKPVADHGWAFEEVSRREGDFALAAAGAVIDLGGGSGPGAVRIALMGVGDTPVRARDAEAEVSKARATDGQLDDRVLRRIAEATRAAVIPNSDLHASADYRRHLAGVLACRVVTKAWKRAGASERVR
jgi:carbon-monoxide dehydrogenase medium subunit